MQPRFVIVPAVPIGKDSTYARDNFDAATKSAGFDIYDNQAKIRLRRAFSDRATAMAECERLITEARIPE
ncbi:hypothetical protein [Pseudomonas monteilii]|uniref:Uncharacterized protein n=1 Tax=Pseudomonas monteilii TaxID=76759 RepID=A0A399LXS6_9PSED|nr:hypothetical protein [Pseudomonas monteilii]RII74353.1 hypothetical protein D0894_27275 [Pseudomonas monteilii]